MNKTSLSQDKGAFCGKKSLRQSISGIHLPQTSGYLRLRVAVPALRFSPGPAGRLQKNDCVITSSAGTPRKADGRAATSREKFLLRLGNPGIPPHWNESEIHAAEGEAHLVFR